MNKLITALLVLALTACAAPIAQTPAAQQPVVVNVTVVAPASTNAPAATAVPATDVPTAVPATDVPPASAPEPTATAAPNPTATSQPAVGADVLSNITRSGDAFSLKCSPSELTFGATSINAYITKVQFFYRMVDKLNNMASPWSGGADTTNDGKGNYSIKFSALDVNPDVRYANGWFEYQFVGMNKTGDVVGRTKKFEQLVTFTLNCP